MECPHTLCLNNVYGTSIIMCLETHINCFTMVKYHFAMSRRNATFWSKVGEMGVGEMGVGEMGVGEMGVGEMGVGEMGVDEMGVGEQGIFPSLP